MITIFALSDFIMRMLVLFSPTIIQIIIIMIQVGQIFLQLILAFMPKQDPVLIYIQSIVPLLSLSGMTSMATTANNKEVVLTFGNLFTENLGIPGLYLGYILVIQLCGFLLWALLLLYSWPLVIDPDLEHPLPWYYCLTCGRSKSKQKSEEEYNWNKEDALRR
jgi:hypothetical protein